MNKINAGDMAPDFKAPDHRGKIFELSKQRGKKVILFFYPQDNTPTCTEEACNLRDNYSKLKKMGFKIVGISADSVKKHRNFIQKFNLPFDLVADVERKVIEAYGVWGEKTLFGRTYDGILRTTYIIDESGKVIKRIDDVKSKQHAEQIISELGLK